VAHHPPASLKLDKVKESGAVSYDEEAGLQHHDVTVTFRFENGHVVTKQFSNGETALGMKKQLFDLLQVDYGKLDLLHNDKPLIDPLSIIDTPSLKSAHAFDLTVRVPGGMHADDKWKNAQWPSDLAK
jgi:hypothetical protein